MALEVVPKVDVVAPVLDWIGTISNQGLTVTMVMMDLTFPFIAPDPLKFSSTSSGAAQLYSCLSMLFLSPMQSDVSSIALFVFTFIGLACFGKTDTLLCRP
jgi:hypothetical protein